MEAFMYRFHPRTLKIKELLDAGAIGEVRLVRASFGFTVVDPANVRLSAELAGGALMDVGCYCVNFARMVAGGAAQLPAAAAPPAPSRGAETLAGARGVTGGGIARTSLIPGRDDPTTAQG